MGHRLLVPVLCPCTKDFKQTNRNKISDLLSSLGFDAVFTECLSLTAALEDLIIYRQDSPPVGFPICMPVLTPGNTRRKGGHKPCPALDGRVKYLERPHKRLFLFYAEADVVVDDAVLKWTDTDNDCVIRFARDAMSSSFPTLIHQLLKLKEILRVSPRAYVLPQVQQSALNYLSADKRTTVSDGGFGLIEYKWEILAWAASTHFILDSQTGESGRYEFHHQIAVIPDPDGVSVVNVRTSLEKMATDNLDEIFDKTFDSFGVLAFGDNLRASWRPTPELGDSSAMKWICVEIRSLTGDPLPDGSIISYGIIWSARKLFNVDNDASSLIAIHNYERVHYSLRFMRKTLSEHPTRSFKLGPRLERFGPYQNDMGFIDSEGVYDEGFHYIEFPWEERRLSAGSTLRITWITDDA